RSAHRVLVVLDREHDRQVPQRGHVEGLVDLALVGRAIPKIGEADAAIVAVLVREGEARAERHLRADDAVPAVKRVLGAEHVHRAALALRDAGLAPGQLGHDDLGVDPVGEHVAVIAVAGDDAVLAFLQCRLQPDRDGLLADVEMAEPADQAETIELPGLLLEAADQQHLFVEVQQKLRFGLVAAVLLEPLLKATKLEISRTCCGVFRTVPLGLGGIGTGGAGRGDFLCSRPNGGSVRLAYKTAATALATPRMRLPAVALQGAGSISMTYSSGCATLRFLRSSSVARSGST